MKGETPRQGEIVPKVSSSHQKANRNTVPEAFVKLASRPRQRGSAGRPVDFQHVRVQPGMQRYPVDKPAWILLKQD
jgi:hypothetical protein